eukprot:scaffold165769_cov23-Tisochrysis_lutea.AAC.1
MHLFRVIQRVSRGQGPVGHIETCIAGKYGKTVTKVPGLADLTTTCLKSAPFPTPCTLLLELDLFKKKGRSSPPTQHLQVHVADADSDVSFISRNSKGLHSTHLAPRPGPWACPNQCPLTTRSSLHPHHPGYPCGSSSSAAPPARQEMEGGRSRAHKLHLSTVREYA